MDVRRVGAIYLMLQSLAAIIWWAVLLIDSSFRRLFLPTGVPDSVLLAFLLPDLLVYIGTSVAAGIRLFTRKPWELALHIHIGAALYAALYCLSLSLSTGQAWASVALMLPAAAISCYLASRLER